nr:hypothetical protein [Bradyrhizobium manausense]
MQTIHVPRSSIPASAAFGLAGAVTAQVLAFALLIGGIANPGAFLANAVA